MKILHSSKDCEVAFLEAQNRNIVVQNNVPYPNYQSKIDFPNLLLVKSNTQNDCNCTQPILNKNKLFFIVAVEGEVEDLTNPIKAHLTPFSDLSIGHLSLGPEECYHKPMVDIIDWIFNSTFFVYSRDLFRSWFNNDYFNGEYVGQRIVLHNCVDPIKYIYYIDDFYVKDPWGDFEFSPDVINTKISDDYFSFLKDKFPKISLP